MGPLKGYRIIEIAGIGPGPFACMMLADMGADVIRLERPTGARGVDAVPGNVLNRGRRSVGIDLKHPDAVELTLRLVEAADGLLPLRAKRSMRAKVARSARDLLASIRSMRMPLCLWKSPAR